jgi:hypothetical protein
LTRGFQISTTAPSLISIFAISVGHCAMFNVGYVRMFCWRMVVCGWPF